MKPCHLAYCVITLDKVLKLCFAAIYSNWETGTVLYTPTFFSFKTGYILYIFKFGTFIACHKLFTETWSDALH